MDVVTSGIKDETHAINPVIPALESLVPTGVVSGDIQIHKVLVLHSSIDYAGGGSAALSGRDELPFLMPPLLVSWSNSWRVFELLPH